MSATDAVIDALGASEGCPSEGEGAEENALERGGVISEVHGWHKRFALGVNKKTTMSKEAANA